MSAAPLIPRRTQRVVRSGLLRAYRSGWRCGVLHGALLGALLIVLLTEGARRLT